MPKTKPTHIRWMIRRDMPEVLAIEEGSYDWPWEEEDFLRHLRQRNCIGMVIEEGDKVVGFMMYELHKAHIGLVNLAVHPDYRRQGAGTALAQKLKDKLSGHRRTTITLNVRETNVDAQRFFSACGFMAVKVNRSEYEDNNEDAYQMEYRIDGEYPGIKRKPKRVVEVDFTNRITDMFRRK